MFVVVDSPLTALTTLCLLLFVYLATLATYRLIFHPLARFPGPKLAALSKWYEFYYDVVLKGQFMFNIQELHKQYGPIIRITPDEIHVADPDFFNDFLTKQGPQHKYDWSANRFNNETSTFSTVPHDVHKLRRNALENMFSRQQIRHLLPLLQSKVAKMLAKFKEYQSSGEPVNLLKAYMALAEDMIFEYSFDMSYDKLGSPGFDGILHEVIVAAGSGSAFFLQFPTLARILYSLSDSLVLKLDPGLAPLINLRKVSLLTRAVVLASPVPRSFRHTNGLQYFEVEIDKLEDPTHEREKKSHKTVIYELINNPDLPPSEKSRQHLLDESQLVIGAGLSTTGWAGAVAIYDILANPSIYSRVRQELLTIIPPDQKRIDCTDLDWAALESLPYFQACIKEALRLSYGTTARLTRRTPKLISYTESPATTSTTSQHQNTWQIPANTPVSVSIYIHNHDERIFPNSYTYNPDRWLTTPRIPEKYFVSFSKGSRSCLGMQLAWAELSLMLAGTIRWFDMQLFETGERDVRVSRDLAVPVVWEGSKGVRARVVGEVD